MGKKLLPSLGNLLKKADAKGGQVLGDLFGKFNNWLNPKLESGISNLKAKEQAAINTSPPPMFRQKESPVATQVPQTPEVQPMNLATPTPAPFEFNFKPHINKGTKREIYAPPAEDFPLYQEYFPKDATQSATVAFNESMYNPSAKNSNKDGTTDRGYFQINDVAYNDLMKYYPNTMKKLGVTKREDLFDKRKNFAVAKLYQDKFEKRPGTPLWGHWQGWKDQGFTNVGNPNVNYQ